MKYNIYIYKFYYKFHAKFIPIMIQLSTDPCKAGLYSDINKYNYANLYWETTWVSTFISAEIYMNSILVITTLKSFKYILLLLTVSDENSFGYKPVWVKIVCYYLETEVIMKVQWALKCSIWPSSVPPWTTNYLSQFSVIINTQH